MTTFYRQDAQEGRHSDGSPQTPQRRVGCPARRSRDARPRPRGGRPMACAPARSGQHRPSLPPANPARQHGVSPPAPSGRPPTGRPRRFGKLVPACRAGSGRGGCVGRRRAARRRPTTRGGGEAPARSWATAPVLRGPLRQHGKRLLLPSRPFLLPWERRPPCWAKCATVL